MASYGTPFGRMGLDWWFDILFVGLLRERPEPFVDGGEAGAHKGGYEDFGEGMGFKFVAGEANEGGTDNEEV